MCVQFAVCNCCTQYCTEQTDNFPSCPPDNHHCSDDVYLIRTLFECSPHQWRPVAHRLAGRRKMTRMSWCELVRFELRTSTSVIFKTQSKFWMHARGRHAVWLWHRIQWQKTAYHGRSLLSMTALFYMIKGHKNASFGITVHQKHLAVKAWAHPDHRRELQLMGMFPNLTDTLPATAGYGRCESSLWMQISARWLQTLRPWSQPTWTIGPSVDCYCPQPSSPFIMVTQLERRHLF